MADSVRNWGEKETRSATDGANLNKVGEWRMAGFRVTKYDPRIRTPDGSYPLAEWTSVGDVGKTYDGRVVDVGDYMRVEDAYVAAAKRFLAASDVRQLRVVALERVGFGLGEPVLASSEAIAAYERVFEGKEVAAEDFEWVVRLALREVLWCRLEGERGFYVHFGYDYYMYVGWDEARPRVPEMPDGVFVEIYASPYREGLLESDCRRTRLRIRPRVRREEPRVCRPPRIPDRDRCAW